MQLNTFLMFTGRAEEAMNFYASLFDGAQITSLTRHAAGGPGAEGTLQQGTMLLGRHTLRFFDSPVKHAFDFTPAMSLWIDCDDDAQVARLAQTLAQDGQVLMPVDAYPFSRCYGWVQDRFGVSWQLSVPAAP